MGKQEKRVLTLDRYEHGVWSMPSMKCGMICWRKNAPPTLLTKFF